MARLAIKRERAIKLFQTCGFKTAETWNNTQLTNKLKQLPELTEGVKIKDAKMKKLLQKVIKADTIRIKSANESKEVKEKIGKDTKVAKKKSSKKKSSKKKSEKSEKAVKKNTKKKAAKTESKKKSSKNKSKKTKTEKKVSKSNSAKAGKFGCRKGTIKAKIAEVITKKSKTHEQILEDAGVDTRQTGYLNEFIKAGYIVKTSKGYALKK